MSVIDLLLDLFRDDEQRTELADDPTAYLDEHAPDGLSAEDILAAMPGVCAALPPEQADAVRTAYGLEDTSGPAAGAAGRATEGPSSTAESLPGTSFPPPPAPEPGDDPVEAVMRQLNYFTYVTNVTRQSLEDNDVTTIDDRDTAVDQSVNQDITAFGDIDQNFDNDVVSGDGAVAAGDGSTVNTGDGAVQAGDDISDSTIATGNVSGTVTGDVSDSVVGEGNQVIQDSEVGAATFGSGDATNVEAANANFGDGNIIDDTSGDVALNQGDGTQIVDSDLDESVVGSGSVESDDVSITADDGSAVAFGDGDANAEEQNVNIEDNVGTVQVAGDQSSQTGLTDQSTNENFDADNSFNTAIEETDNSINGSFDTENSFNPDNSLTDQSVTDQSDDDVIDIA
jgi:hypothetical protein